MSFHYHEQNNGLVFLTSDFLPADIHHGFSTRKGGVSPEPWNSLNLGIGRGDAIENVQENYRRFCAAIQVNVNHVVLSRQVHEDHIRLVTSEDIGKGLWRDRDYTSVDAMICNVPGIPLVVFSADCGIILLYDPVTKVIGAVHAGWRGAASGIVHKTVLELQRVFHCNPENIIAVLGPSIGPCCFETDNDVPNAMHTALGNLADPYMTWNGKKWHIDLKGINSLWLQQTGVRQIDVCPDCTCCRTDLYWSHRKSGNVRGAQTAVISL